MTNSTQKLISLVNVENPDCVFDEVKIILHSIKPDFLTKEIADVYHDVIRLFQGKYEGYKACNTEYHDLRHTMDVFLATTRLIHGTFIDGEILSEKTVNICIISALMHDTGYNQTIDDTTGTGAKYTANHVLRSIEFCSRYFADSPYFRHDLDSFRDVLLCTGYTQRINEIRFSDHEVETAGKILGAADLLGQMADRNYLEKLLFLYFEFKEAGITGYEDEYDLLKKSLEFYSMTLKRLESDLGNVHRHMRSHFKIRWGIDEDLYMESMKNNIDYLNHVIRHGDYASLLRRGQIVQKISRRRHQISRPPVDLSRA